MIYEPPHRKGTGSGNTKKLRVKVTLKSLNLLWAALRFQWVWGLSGERCTLVTDQTSGVLGGNGIDTATSRKITKEGKERVLRFDP